MFDGHRYLLTAVLCFALICSYRASEASNSEVVVTQHSQLGPEGRVDCMRHDSHPVCVASYSNNPSSTLGRGGLSSGEATVNGVVVNFTCLPGDASARTPRQCSWHKK